MSFKSSKEALDRLGKAEPLSDADFQGLFEWINGVGEAGRYLLELHLTWLSVHATRQFEDSSRRLNRWLIRLTIVLVILTVVIAGFTVLLWMRG